MPRSSKKARAAKGRVANYVKGTNGRHFASNCLETYPMGENYSSSAKTVKLVDSEAKMEVEEVSIYDAHCRQFEEFSDSLAEDGDNFDHDMENKSFSGSDSMDCDNFDECMEEDYDVMDGDQDSDNEFEVEEELLLSIQEEIERNECATGISVQQRAQMLRRLAYYTHKDMDIFKMKIFLMPANIANSHWIWFLIHPESKTVYAYDGFHNSYRRYYSFILNWLEVEASKEGCTFDFNRDEWTFKDALGPRQINGYDCGMYMLKGIEYVCDNLPLTYSQDQMPYLRMDMMIDMEKGRLVGRPQQDPFSMPLHEYKGQKEDLFIIEDDEDEDDEAPRNMNIDLDWSPAFVEEQAKLLAYFEKAMRQ